MQMKKISIIVTLLFAALLCACAPQIHTQNPTEGSTEPPQPVWQPITKLECIQPSSAPVVLPAQEGLLACWMDFSAAPVTHLRRVDIAADEVTAAADFDGCLDLFAENFSDGGYVLRDGANEQWVLLNADLQEQTRFAAKSMDGFFSHNRSRFYFVEGGRLFCTEIGSGATAPVETGYDLHFSHIAAFHPTQEQIALRVDVSPFSYEDGTAIFDLDSGSFLFLEDGMYTVTFGDDGIRLLCYEEQAQGYSMTFTAGEQTAKIAPADLAQKTGLIAVSGSPYLAGFDNGTELYRLNDTVTVCSLRENGLSDMLTEYAWLPEDGLLVGSVWQETGAELYLICPELLPFDKEVPAEPVQPLGVDAGVETRYWEAMNGGMLPDYMMELRSRADALEQTYGITVLLSSQAAALAEQSSFELVLTDTMPQEEELAATGHFLDALQECLSCYPKDFFRQFQNVHGEGGLCFFPSAHIVSDNGAIGVCYECLAWQGITLDATRDTMFSSFCHEIWHATEAKIIERGVFEFLDEDWMRYNPQGFRYTEDDPSADPYDLRWTMVGDGEDGVYFIDAYARTNAKEDRARLMEYVMAQPWSAETVRRSPVLMEKLKAMSEAIRTYFDTTQWTDVPWEQFAQ